MARPRNNLPTYPSMASCSSATGIPLTVLRKLKKSGCDAFSAVGAVNLSKLLTWVFSEKSDESDDDAGIDWIKEKAKTQTLRERIKLAQDERQVIGRDEVAHGIKAGVAILFADLERIFASELPPVLKGLDELSIRGKVLEEIETMKASLRQKFEDMEKKKEEA